MVLEIKNLTKKIDKNIILDNINLNLKENKIYGFIGRNGSGKSVLFKLICGFYKPSSGEIIIDGNDINKNNNFLPDTRILIEKPNFISDLTGFENLKLLSKIQNKITDKEINEALDIVNLSEEERHVKYHKYSLGMKQKLGIAQVIMEDPKIMIFDEPFNGIEEETVLKLKKYFKKIDKKNKIILFSSHIKEDILEICDVVYEVKNHEITQYKARTK